MNDNYDDVIKNLTLHELNSLENMNEDEINLFLENKLKTTLNTLKSAKNTAMAGASAFRKSPVGSTKNFLKTKKTKVLSSIAPYRKGRINVRKMKELGGDELKRYHEVRKANAPLSKQTKALASNIDGLKNSKSMEIESLRKKENDLRDLLSGISNMDRKNRRSIQYKAKVKSIQNQIIQHKKNIKQIDDKIQTTKSNRNVIQKNINSKIGEMNKIKNDPNLREKILNYKAEDLRQNAKKVGYVTGSLATTASTPVVVKKYKSYKEDKTYQNLNSVIRTCEKLHKKPKDIEKCKERLYKKYNISTAGQRIDSIKTKMRKLFTKNEDK